MSWFSKKTPEQIEAELKQQLYKKQQRLQKDLFKAIHTRKLEKVIMAIEKGADINEYCHKISKRTPLAEAVYYRSEKIVQFLLDSGADINKGTSEFNFTPIMTAIYEYQKDIALMLLNRGANPTLMEKSSKRTALHYAAMNGQTKVIEKILDDHPELLNQQCDDNKTALHYAAYNDRGSTVQLLVNRGADIYIKDKRLFLPIDHAKNWKYNGIVSFLEEKMGYFKGPKKDQGIEKEWVVTKPHEIAHIFDQTSLGYRITEIFNFQTQIYTEISRNLQTDAESKACLRFRDFANDNKIEEARKKLENDQKGDLSNCQDAIATKPAMIKNKGKQ